MFSSKCIFEWLRTTTLSGTHLQKLVGWEEVSQGLDGVILREQLSLDTETYQTYRYLLTTENSLILGVFGHICTADGNLLPESDTFSRLSAEQVCYLQNLATHPPEILSGITASISGLGYESYYHWMLDILPRFKILSSFNIKFDHLVTSPITAHFQWETLERVGVKREIVVCCSGETVIRTETLKFPSFPSVNASKDLQIINWLRELYPLNPNTSHKRIYISRKMAQRRRLVNEEEVILTLAQFQFQIIQSETLSVQEQALLMNNTDVLIGVHGAGLTNMIFCHPNTKIVEIATEFIKYDNTCYRDLAKTSSVTHYYLLSEPRRNESYNSPLHSDLYLPIERLTRFLQKLLGC